jgi:hypothetical protein
MMDFETWENEVNQIFLDYYGCGRDDFEDWTWFTAYDDGLTPREAFDLWGEENRG